MKADPHLIESEVWLIEGQTYLGKCGEEIARARFVLIWDSIEMGGADEFTTLRCCKKCLQKLIDESAAQTKRERYIYGILSAEQDMGEVA